MRLQGGIFEIPGTLTHSGLQLLPGLDAFLSLLRIEGVELYGVTEGSRSDAQELLRQIGLTSSFRGILSAEEQGCAITSPTLYEKAARRLGTSPRVTAVFTPRPSLLPCLRPAGFRTILVGRAFSQEERALAELAISDYRAMIHAEPN